MIRKILIITAFLSSYANAELQINHNLKDIIVCNSAESAKKIVRHIVNGDKKELGGMIRSRKECSVMDKFSSKYEVITIDVYNSEDLDISYCKLAVFQEIDGTTKRDEIYAVQSSLSDPCNFYIFNAFDRYYDPSQDK